MHSTAGESESTGESPADESISPTSNSAESGASNQYLNRSRLKSTGNLAPDVDAVRESLGMMKLDRKGKAMYHGETHWGALLNEVRISLV